MNPPATAQFSLRALFDSAHDGVFVLDANRRFVLFNPACERLTGRSAGEIIGTSCDGPNPDRCTDQRGDSPAALLCPDREVLQDTANPPPRQVHVETGNGQQHRLEIRYLAVRDAEGRPQCIIGVVRSGTAPGPEESPETTSLDERLADIERHAILAAIRRASGRRNLAARLMGISRSRLYRRLEALGINPDDATDVTNPPPAGEPCR